MERKASPSSRGAQVHVGACRRRRQLYQFLAARQHFNVDPQFFNRESVHGEVTVLNDEFSCARRSRCRASDENQKSYRKDEEPPWERPAWRQLYLNEEGLAIITKVEDLCCQSGAVAAPSPGEMMSDVTSMIRPPDAVWHVPFSGWQ